MSPDSRYLCNMPGIVVRGRGRTSLSSALSRVGPSGVPVIDIYAWISRAANGETIEVDDQVEMGLEVIERRGGEVGERFKDNSLSAWNPRVVRQSWNSMMARLESDASDAVDRPHNSFPCCPVGSRDHPNQALRSTTAVQ